MAKENTTVYIILGLLQHENLSGYDIKKRIDVMISEFWKVGYGQIYPTLKVIEQEGLVVRAADDTAHDGDRIVYAITDAGRKRLSEWLLLPDGTDYVKYEILIKLFFGNLISPADNINRIASFQEKSAQTLQKLMLFKKNLEAVLDGDDDHLYYYLTVLFGEHMYNAYLQWAQEAVALLTTKDTTASERSQSK